MVNVFITHRSDSLELAYMLVFAWTHIFSILLKTVGAVSTIPNTSAFVEVVSGGF